MPAHRLLIVEDHAPTRHVLARLFGRLGWEVAAVGTVAEGLARLDAGAEPCCLILDLDLPDGRGEEVLRRVRGLGLRTRVAVATGGMDGERLAAVAALGPDALLVKPVTVEALWACGAACPVGHCVAAVGDGRG